MNNFLLIKSRLINKSKYLAIILIAIATLSLSLSLTGCSALIARSNMSNIPQIVDAILSDPKTFNPVLSSDATSTAIGAMLFDGLITQNPITGETEPALAESWTVSDDDLEIIFTLRKNLKWSDNRPLTADDVVFTFNELYLNDAIPSGAKDTLRVGESQQLPKVEKLNDLQIKFTLPEPFAPFFSTIGKSILPQHILKPTVDKKDAEGNPIFMSTWSVDTPPNKLVANSAYQMQEYSNAQRIIFTANPNYWKQGKNGETLPKVPRIVWQIVESTDTSFLQFRSGGLDSLAVTPDFFSLLKKEEQRGNFTIYNGGPAYGDVYITFNLNKGKRNGKFVVDPIKSQWFNNVQFRQAIAYSIDRQSMINNIYRGLGQPQNSPISIQSPYYDDSLPGYKYNLEKAKTLFKEAGFTYSDRQQLRDSNGNLVTFTLSTNAGNKIREAMGSQIKENLSQVGIKVNFKPIAFNLLVDRLDNTLEWDCTLLGFTGGNEPNNGANIWYPDGELHMFNQSKKGLEGRIVSDWEKEIERLYIKAARELEEAKRKAIYKEAQAIIAEQLPFIYLVNPLSLGAVRNQIQPIEYSALGGAYWNLPELAITEN
jgi:peptide/nickel transport system substrate-binding protein